MLNNLAAISFAALTGVAVMFQVALACGAPWGELTLGGKYRGRLPGFVRIVPIVSAALLTGFAVIVLAHAGLAFANMTAISNRLIWVVVAYCVAGTFANFVTPSRREQMLWFPIVALMLVSSTIVAVG
ncbi:MAG: hypothetical protein H7Z39_01975 [Burkholderiaceae bacterium]|nr:hypothetical protein [Burkholderiaceae bacterium]